MTREIVTYLATFAVASGVLLLFLRALERSILRNPSGSPHALVLFVLPAAFLALFPTAISQAPDWTLYPSVAVLGGLAIYRFLRTLKRVARLQRSPDGGAWKPDGGAWKPETKEPPPSS